MIVEDIALTLIPGLGLKGVVHLLEIFTTAEKVFRASREELIHFAQLRSGAVVDAIVGRVTMPMAQREMEHCRRNDILAICSTDEEYPPMLLLTPDYPHVIYVMGDPAVLSQRCISIIGTRRITPYGDRITDRFVQDLGALVPRLSVVSGLAFGVDSSAHRAAIHYDVPTVAVLANPLPAITPAQNSGMAAAILKQGGALVSELHSQTKYNKSLYIARNRIIAALSSATIVVESPLSGGSMVTAKIVSDYQRQLYAVPGRLSDVNSSGCNQLIHNNIAKMLLSAEMLVRDLMWDCDQPADRPLPPSPLCASLTPEQQSIVGCFRSDDPLNIEQISQLTGFEVTQLSTMLVEMELLGVLRMLPGNRYEVLSVVISG